MTTTKYDKASLKAAKAVMITHFARILKGLIKGYYKPKDREEFVKWVEVFVKNNHKLFWAMTFKLAQKIENVSK